MEWRRRCTFWTAVLGVLVVCTHGEVEIVDHFKERTKLINDHASKMEAQRSDRRVAVDDTVAKTSKPAKQKDGVVQGDAASAKRVLAPPSNTPSSTERNVAAQHSDAGTDAPAAAEITTQGKPSGKIVTDASVDASGGLKRDAQEPDVTTASKPPVQQADNGATLPPGKTQWADTSDVATGATVRMEMKATQIPKYVVSTPPPSTVAQSEASALESVASTRKKDQQPFRSTRTTAAGSRRKAPASTIPLPDVDDPLFAAFLRDLEMEESKRPHGEVVDVQCPPIGECSLTYRS